MMLVYVEMIIILALFRFIGLSNQLEVMGTARTDDRLDHRAIQTLKRVLLRVEKVDGRLIEEDFWYQSPEG